MRPETEQQRLNREARELVNEQASKLARVAYDQGYQAGIDPQNPGSLIVRNAVGEIAHGPADYASCMTFLGKTA